MTLFVDKLKSAVKLVIPSPLHRIAREYLSQRWDAKHEGRPVEEIFSAIYRERKWGTKSDSDFSSGSGSHIQSVVSSYVNAVRGFLESLPCPPSVVDLGCGDFNVGKQLRPYCGRYIACDVVPALIQRNKDQFVDMQVDFRCIDIIEDDLPEGDIVFLRQILQHLNNAQILKGGTQAVSLQVSSLDRARSNELAFSIQIVTKRLETEYGCHKVPVLYSPSPLFFSTQSRSQLSARSTSQKVSTRG